MTTYSNNAVVAVYKLHTDAEAAVKELYTAGFDMKKLSILAREYQTEEKVVGYYNTGDRMMYWGSLGLFWGWIWGLLFGSAVLFVPGVGTIIAGGPIVLWIVGALENAILVGGLSALGAGLFSAGIPKDSVVKYETELNNGKFVLIAHGTEQESQQAREILANCKAESVDYHIGNSAA